MNLARILTIATNVFREVIRDRILYLIGLYALFMVAAMALLPEIAGMSADKILVDLGLATMEVLGLLIAVFVGAGLVNKEIEKRTVFVLIAKPVSRAEFVVGKHLGLSGVLAVLLLAMGAIYLGILSLNHVSYPGLSVGTAIAFLFLQLSLMTAVALLFSLFTSSLLATLLSLSVYLIGQFSRDLVSMGKLTQNPELLRLTKGIYLVLPDLARFNLKNTAVYGVMPDSLTLATSAGYGVLYIGLLLAIATLIFAQREF